MSPLGRWQWLKMCLGREKASQQLRALMLTDLEHSSAWKLKLGDKDYAKKIALPHNAMFRKVLAAIHGAHENNYTGDGFLSTFLHVRDAVNAALCFQQLLRSYAWETDEAVKTRIGIHVGESVFLGRSAKAIIVSHAADMCARVMSLGQGGQILLTRHAFDDGRQFVREHPSLTDGGDPPPIQWMSHGHYRFQGKDDDPLEVFEVGAIGLAPLTAPPGSDKARRMAKSRRTLR